MTVALASVCPAVSSDSVAIEPVVCEDEQPPTDHRTQSGGRRPDPLSRSTAHFARLRGSDLTERTRKFFEWQDARRQTSVWPYGRSLSAAPTATTVIRDDRGNISQGLNFASQDYLSLAAHPEVHRAAVEAISEFGVHSAGSPALTGNTSLSLQLEQKLADMLNMQQTVLFPTGWAAGFGTITALVRPDDHIVMDELSHACLQQGAAAATKNVIHHPHLDVASVRRTLSEIRSSDSKNGTLVVTEGLFSMDSDMPDLPTLQATCHEFGARLLVDVAHDFGATGPNGTGTIGLQKMLGEIDLVMGSFSKTFASNGGFLTTHDRAVKEYVKYYGGAHTFSNALSPIQAAVVLKAVEIVRSHEGAALRTSLNRSVKLLRHELTDFGLECIGSPSPIVPVKVGGEAVGRIASRLIAERGLLANLVEFPAVGVGSARFRLQVQSAHSRQQSAMAAGIIAEAVQQARDELGDSNS